MDGFYKWKPDKSPVRFVRRQRDVFCVASLLKEIEKPCVDLPVTGKHFVLLKERWLGRAKRWIKCGK
jgi:putative SOS response-associated peptidase YedK